MIFEMEYKGINKTKKDECVLWGFLRVLGRNNTPIKDFEDDLEELGKQYAKLYLFGGLVVLGLLTLVIRLVIFAVVGVLSLLGVRQLFN